MYADDIIILSPSMQGLQHMLNICYSVSSELLLQFNPGKCHLIAFDPLACKTGGPLFIGSDTINWTHPVKHLGVHIVCGKKLSFDINPIKRTFFTACNTVCSQSRYMDSILQLLLIETDSVQARVVVKSSKFKSKSKSLPPESKSKSSYCKSKSKSQK